MRISIFGLGYVGCVSAARLAEAGHYVIGVDVNETKVDMISRGQSPIVEPGLRELLSSAVQTGRLTATTSAASAIERSDLAFICVGTPGYQNGELNVENLGRVCREIGRVLGNRTAPFTVVIRSTVLPGTVESTVVPALRAGLDGSAGPDIRVASNPEFMREGTALEDFLHPPITLVGCESAETAATLRKVYAAVEAPFVHTGIRTAEMVKYVANAFHAAKICFANEIGDVCAALGADQQEVMRIFRMDRKLNISDAYLRPGFAFGGSCLPKDVRALAYAANRFDVSTPMLSTILPSNESQIRRAVEKILATRKRRIGIVGLAFKPGTDDLRESPMVSLAEALIGKGCHIRILDRNVSIARLTGANRKYIEEEIPHIASLMCEHAAELVAHAEVLVIGNDGEELRQVMTLAEPAKTVIDLTRGAARLSPPAKEEKTPWLSMESKSSPQHSLSLHQLQHS